MAMVEFALVAPLAFLILLGIVITGVAVSNQIALSNGVRDAVRAAAVCGGNTGPRDSTTQLPSSNGQAAQTCSWAALQTYISARLNSLAGAGALGPPTGSFSSNSNCAAVSAAEVCLYKSDGTAIDVTSSNPLDLCQKGYKIEVASQYGQALFVPLVGHFLGSNGSSSTRNLTADAQATCEQ
jgi:Flp pilus assembly protein TadG